MEADKEAGRIEIPTSLWHNAERLAILHEIDQSILGARLPETIALAAIGRLARLVPYQRALVLAFEQGDGVRLLACQSLAGVELSLDPNAYRVLIDEPILVDGGIYGVEDLAAVPLRTPLQRTLHGTGVRAYVVVPLLSQGGLAGTLNLESTEPHAFTAEQITVAREVATSLAVAIGQARLHARLQKELEERVQAELALQRRTAALEAHNAELDAFAHTVAHDLKNPLSAIVGYSEMLRSKRDRLDAAQQARCLEAVAVNARKMSAIIDELLLLASVRTQEDVKTAPLDMAHIVQEAIDRLRYMIDDLHAEIVVPDAWPVACGYGPWVEEVWVNYVSNALKYGGNPPHVELGCSGNGHRPKGDPGSLRADSAKPGTGSLHSDIVFWVRDNGPGLSLKERAALFTPFERLHQVHGDGHGLGLSIVQRIVQKLGGTVGVRSDGIAGSGCTFYFTLPGEPLVGEPATSSTT